ncbi:hypothetical protein TTHERM_000429929 (macronuclear) [Tetrahymena thermophila SB210]|uniref:Uncharacterized protein n=1 Tax=Tetrahymena thermophila (strain SB210) TaxID=312017 RepID=W7X891_TETTS|nr:hypothetical protein TTHERM_000429929 [Tetrahymena thermophila SB210]EWS72623.1 hypothetical protein TTHERM_000429929 [Tetrahymena thermophila SB210]|eukprot:XP_012654906.1 hypothetical protein TTHERM_000429929 [Tetrahymena thermophila SB210]
MLTFGITYFSRKNRRLSLIEVVVLNQQINKFLMNGFRIAKQIEFLLSAVNFKLKLIIQEQNINQILRQV